MFGFVWTFKGYKYMFGNFVKSINCMLIKMESLVLLSDVKFWGVKRLRGEMYVVVFFTFLLVCYTICDFALNFEIVRITLQNGPQLFVMNRQYECWNVFHLPVCRYISNKQQPSV